MDNRFGEMDVFARSVAAGSFSGAARQLGLTPSAVSKLVSRLEDRLSTRLLVRSTRNLTPTPEGELYLAEARQILDRLDQMEAQVSDGAKAVPRGLLRINSTVAFGEHRILPLVPAFLDKYPEVELDLSLTDGMVDLWQERADIAIRSGDLRNSALKSRRIATTRRIIVASPAYLARNGIPEVPGDLTRHDCLRLNFRSDRDEWVFLDPANGSVVTQSVCGSFLGNSGSVLRNVCLSGRGLIRTGAFHVEDALASGTLVEVLSNWMSETEEIHAVFADHPQMATRIRAFIDFLRETL